MLNKNNRIKVQIKYNKGILAYEKFINSINQNTIDKMTVSKIIVNKKQIKNIQTLHDLIMKFTFKDIRKSYIFKGGVLIYPNSDLFIIELKLTHIKYIVRSYNHYETMSFIINEQFPHNVIVEKTRLRRFTISKLKKWHWNYTTKNELKNILIYLSKTND